MAIDSKKLQATIDSWAKGQKVVEEATAALESARAGTAGFAKTIYDAMGSKPFTVKALAGRKYRAMHKKERLSKVGNKIAEQWHVIPVPEFEAEANY
jgi:hypothetical protein